MLSIRSKYRLLFILIVAALSAENIHAQTPNMAAKANDQALQNMMQRMNDKPYADPRSLTTDYVFSVVLKDGTKRKIRSDVHYDASLHKSYLIDNSGKTGSDGQRVYASQTISISRFDSVGNMGDFIYVKGMANDSIWMFRALAGTISVYSYRSEYEEFFNSGTTAGIQLNNGPILNFTEENLKQLLVKDEKALKILEKKGYLAAIRKYNRDFGPKFVPPAGD